MTAKRFWTAALTIHLLLSPMGLAATYNANWLNGFGDGVWERDGDGDPGSNGPRNWSTFIYPANGRRVGGSTDLDPRYNVVLGIAAPCTLGTQVTVESLNLSSVASLNIAGSGGGFLAINSPVGITNEGVIFINNSRFETDTLRLDGDAQITGNGAIQLRGIGNTYNVATLTFTGPTVTHGASHTIRGLGTIIGGDSTRMINNGAIIADNPNGDLQLYLSRAGDVVNKNNSTITAVNGAVLGMYRGIVDQTGGGRLLADGVGSIVRLGGSTLARVIDGSLNTANGGLIMATPVGGGATLVDVTNNGAFLIPPGNNPILINNRLTNNGTLTIGDGTLHPGFDTPQLRFETENLLGGIGSVNLRGFGATYNVANLIITGPTLTHDASHTIRGLGSIIGGDSSRLINNGAITADDPSGDLQLYLSRGNVINQNNGTIKASNGAVLGMYRGLVDQSGGGRFLADGAGSRVVIGGSTGATITGGTLETVNGGLTTTVPAGGGAFLDRVTNNGAFLIPPGNNSIVVRQGLTNNGTLTIGDGTLHPGFDAPHLRFESTNSLLGGTGSVRLRGTGDTYNVVGLIVSGVTLTNGADHRIHGLGTLDGFNAGGTLVNNGTITADDPGGNFQLGLSPFTQNQNNNLIQATNGAVLLLSSGEINQSPAGQFLADGPGSVVQLGGAGRAVTVNAGSLATANGGVIRSLTTTLAGNITISGLFEIPAASTTLSFAVALTNDGTMTLRASDSLLRFDRNNTAIEGAGAIALTNNAALQFSGGQTVTNARGHTIKGDGIIYASGASFTDNGTLSPGVSTGRLTFNGNYVQGSSGVLLIELGGTTEGSDYDQLVVNGSASLGGTLNIILNSGFFPSPSDTFRIVTFTSLVNPFPKVASGEAVNTADGKGSFVVTYSGRDVVLSSFGPPVVGRNTPLSLRTINPSVGGDSGVVTVTIFGQGIRAGATILLRRPGGADIIGIVRSVSANGSAAEVSFDLTGRTLGGWEVVVTNADGAVATLANGFTVEQGRPARIWSSIAGPAAVRRDTEHGFFLVYGNSGNVDAQIPLLTLTGNPGTRYHLTTKDQQRESPVHIVAAGAPGSGGVLKPGISQRVRLLVLPPPEGSRLDQQVGMNEVAGLAFDWDLLASAGRPAGVTQADWTARVTRARGVIGESWDEVNAWVAYAHNIVEQDVPEMKDFDRLLRYMVTFYGGPPGEFNAAPSSQSMVAGHRDSSARSFGTEGLPPPLPQPPPAPGGATRLVNLEPVGLLNPNATRNIVITHGLGYPPREVFRETAAEARAQYGDDTNVFFADWSGPQGSGTTTPWECARNVDRNAQELAADLKAGGFDKGLIMAGESAGSPLITKTAEYLKQSGSPEAEHLLLLNPAQEAGGFDQGSPKAVSKNSTSLHTQSAFDSQEKNADRAVALKTRPEADPLEQHTSGITGLLNTLRNGDKSLLEGTIAIEDSGNPNAFDGTFDPETGIYEPNPFFYGYTPLPPDQVPPASPNPGGNSSSRIGFSFDPNDKAGAHGATEQHFIAGHDPMPYVILFENKPEASAPAQEVLITDQLDVSKFNLATFQLGAITFGYDTVVSPPPGLSEWVTDVDLRPANNLIVRILAALNKNTGVVTWRFFSLDPATMLPTGDPFGGFLPPNQTAREGEGAVTFTVEAKPGLTTGTQIFNQARIVFDTNAPIDTPEWLNTIDNSPPTSEVSALPASSTSSAIPVSWSGTDTGAGIQSYAIFVSENGGAYTLWLRTSATSGTYQGRPNANYAFYSVAVDGAGNHEASPLSADASTATLSGQLLNISTRLRVQTGENVLIGGLIITGTEPKRVLLRAIGPSLSQNLDGALADPVLELYQGDTLLARNDNWKDAQQSAIEATTIPPPDERESALVQTLAPGNYTAVMSGHGGGTGVGLVEAYDLDQTAASELANISTRGFVEAGDNVMIGGVIIGGRSGGDARVLVRAIGPSLVASGIAGSLQDPTLELVDGNGNLVGSNDNWQESQPGEIEETTIPPAAAAESAIVITLTPGSYTAVVRGKDGGTGVGLVEVYNLR